MFSRFVRKVNSPDTEAEKTFYEGSQRDLLYLILRALRHQVSFPDMIPVFLFRTCSVCLIYKSNACEQDKQRCRNQREHYGDHEDVLI